LFSVKLPKKTKKKKKKKKKNKKNKNKKKKKKKKKKKNTQTSPTAYNEAGHPGRHSPVLEFCPSRSCNSGVPLTPFFGAIAAVILEAYYGSVFRLMPSVLAARPFLLFPGCFCGPSVCQYLIKLLPAGPHSPSTRLVPTGKLIPRNRSIGAFRPANISELFPRGRHEGLNQVPFSHI